MTLTLRTATPRSDPGLAGLVEAAFQRTGRELRLLEELEAGYPRFDPGLSLVAEEDGEPVGWALFVPRRVQLCGSFVDLAIAGPYGVLPGRRERGVFRFLMQTGLGALRDRGMRGALAIGDPELLAPFGFRSAFDAYATRTSSDQLPEELEDDAADWRPLAGEHLAGLCELYARDYAETPGREERFASAVDWVSLVEGAHCLVLVRDGAPAAYLRFKIRERIDVPECAARDAAARQALLRLLRRLAREHGRAGVELHLPPEHPVARELYLAGAPRESHTLRGGCMLTLLDLPGFFEDTRDEWSRRLARAGVDELSLEFEGGEIVSLHQRRKGLELGSTPVAGRHLALPGDLAPSLLTGQRAWRDLDPERTADEVPEWLRTLFPGAAPAWVFAPPYELVTE